jgi:hypothetical protein
LQDTWNIIPITKTTFSATLQGVGCTSLDCAGSSSLPDSRAEFAVVQDTSTTALIYGGLGVSSKIYSDIWRLTNWGMWTLVSGTANSPNVTSGPNPSARFGFVTCQSAQSVSIGNFSIFGGTLIGGNQTNEIWTFYYANNNWAKTFGDTLGTPQKLGSYLLVNSTNVPPSQSYASCWNDYFGNTFLLTYYNSNSTLWKLKSSNWAYLKTFQSEANNGSRLESNNPSARRKAVVAVGSTNQNLALIFGGVASNGILTDGWIFESFSTSVSICMIQLFVDAVYKTHSNGTCALNSPSNFAQTSITPEPSYCQICSIGNVFTSSNATCSQCAPGYISDGTQSSCGMCSLGKYSAGVSSSCTNCASGSYSNTSACTACTLCGVGRFSSVSGSCSCTACSPGTFSNVSGQSVCWDCPAGQYSNMISSVSSCSKCPVGKYSNSSQSLCTDCVIGIVYTFSSFSQSFSGTYANDAGLSSCSVCPIGTISNMTGSSNCIPCQNGAFSNKANSSVCSNCSYGSFSNQTAMSMCFKCAVGRYSDSLGASSCTSCPAGFYAQSVNMSTCQSCPTGSSSKIGSSACQVCFSGYYSNQSALPSCIQCPVGKYMDSLNSTACFLCSNGTFADTLNSTACRDCQPGYYNTESGQAACQPCLAGSALGLARQTACSICIPGRYASSNGSSICGSCLQGFYTPLSGAAICSKCTIHGTTLNEGAAAETDCVCDAGYYGDLKSSKPCTECPAVAGVSCPLGNNLFFQVQAGFFLASVAPVQTVTCVPADACVKTVNETTVCQVGYTGLGCGNCWPFMYYRANGKCNKCPNDYTKWLTIAGAAIVLGVLFWLIFLHGVRIPMDVKIIVQAVQLLSLFSTISNQWPPILASLFRIMSFFVSLALFEGSADSFLRTSTLKFSLQNVQSLLRSGPSITSRCLCLSSQRLAQYQPTPCGLESDIMQFLVSSQGIAKHLTNPRHLKEFILCLVQW